MPLYSCSRAVYIKLLTQVLTIFFSVVEESTCSVVEELNIRWLVGIERSSCTDESYHTFLPSQLKLYIPDVNSHSRALPSLPLDNKYCNINNTNVAHKMVQFIIRTTGTIFLYLAVVALAVMCYIFLNNRLPRLRMKFVNTFMRAANAFMRAANAFMQAATSL